MIREAKTRGFRVLPSYYEAIRALPDGERLRMYDALFDRGFGYEVGDLPPLLNCYMTLIIPSLDKSVLLFKRQQQNGARGGRPRKQPKQSQTHSGEKPEESQ